MSIKIGQEIAIHTGNTGRRTLGTVVWVGTAEDIGELARGRVPAAIIETSKGDVAVTLLAVPPYADRWTVTRPSREWENDNGELVSGAIASRIDRALANSFEMSK